MERQRVLAVVGAVLLLGAVGVAVATTGTGAADPSISEDEARNVATDHVGGTAEDVELETEDGPVYEVTVDSDEGTVEVDLDGETGDVLEVEPDDDENGSEGDDEDGDWVDGEDDGGDGDDDV